jgi:hypothetical protein
MSRHVGAVALALCGTLQSALAGETGSIIKAEPPKPTSCFASAPCPRDRIIVCFANQEVVNASVSVKGAVPNDCKATLSVSYARAFQNATELSTFAIPQHMPASETTSPAR